jgi:hypothetical protein
MGTVGRRLRVGVTLALVVATVCGSVWGDDDEFPFGPFRMYAGSRELNEPVGDTQVYAVDTAGSDIRLAQDLSGMRRAEIEGQLDLFRDDPERLGLLAASYASRNPRQPPLVSIEIVVEWHEIRDGLVTGKTWTEDVVAWQR